MQSSINETSWLLMSLKHKTYTQTKKKPRQQKGEGKKQKRKQSTSQDRTHSFITSDSILFLEEGCLGELMLDRWFEQARAKQAKRGKRAKQGGERLRSRVKHTSKLKEAKKKVWFGRRFVACLFVWVVCFCFRLFGLCACFAARKRKNKKHQKKLPSFLMIPCTFKHPKEERGCLF